MVLHCYVVELLVVLNEPWIASLFLHEEYRRGHKRFGRDNVTFIEVFLDELIERLFLVDQHRINFRLDGFRHVWLQVDRVVSGLMLWESVRLSFREDLGMLVIFLRDHLFEEAFDLAFIRLRGEFRG